MQERDLKVFLGWTRRRVRLTAEIPHAEAMKYTPVQLQLVLDRFGHCTRVEHVNLRLWGRWRSHKSRQIQLHLTTSTSIV